MSEGAPARGEGGRGEGGRGGFGRGGGRGRGRGGRGGGRGGKLAMTYYWSITAQQPQQRRFPYFISSPLHT